MGKYYRVYADVELGNIESNVEALMALTPAGTKSLAVVKADGYGHGDVAVAKAVYSKVFGYAVATLDEAVNLRENGIDKPILILGFVNTDEYETLVENEVAATVFDYETAEELSEAAKKTGKTAICHIKVDTGMRRIGMEPDESGVMLVKKIKQLPNLNVRGIFTHFAASDETDKTSANRQYEKFNGFIKKLEDEGITFEIKHCANSAAVIDMPDTYKDMVRLGIAMYGMYPSDEVNKDKVQLKPALELKSHVTMVKTVPAGRVCMDQMMVDATSIPDIQRNDVVTLIGKDGNEEITVEEIAALAGTFNYEFVCDLNKRIPRNYYYNGRYIGSHDYFHEKWNLEI